jgi:outer membrane receptor protein involved in Fe transport
VSYTKGYRTAGVSINRQRATAVEYDPEFTDNYELSYKYMNPNFQFSANLFYIQWKDQQVQIQLSNNFYDTQVENAARSNLLGGELETRFLLTSNQKINFGVGFTQTKFEDFETLSENYDGNEFPYAPQFTGRLSHILNLTDDLQFLTVFRYLEKSYNNAENTRKSDSQFYINLNAQYRLASWVFQAYVNNLLDGRFLIYDGRPTSTTSPYQTNYFQTSTPREYGVRVRYDF